MTGAVAAIGACAMATAWTEVAAGAANRDPVIPRVYWTGPRLGTGAAGKSPCDRVKSDVLTRRRRCSGVSPSYAGSMSDEIHFQRSANSVMSPSGTTALKGRPPGMGDNALDDICEGILSKSAKARIAR